MTGAAAAGRAAYCCCHCFCCYSRCVQRGNQELLLLLEFIISVGAATFADLLVLSSWLIAGH